VEPTVSTVVDGVVIGRTGNFLSNLVDIERVEVLRCPQGTVFGKIASAGVVNVITRRPTDVLEGLVRVSATDDDQQTVEAMLSGPITDRVRGRVSAFWKDFDGFVDNEFNGETLNGDESQGVRAKLDIDLSDRANLLLIADYSEQDRNCCTWTVRNAGSPPQFQPFMAFDLQSLDLGDDNDEVLLGSPVFSDMEQGGVSAEFTLDFETFTLTSITAYRSWEIKTEQDVDSLPFTDPTYARVLITSNGGDTEQDQFSQELRIASTAWDTVNLTAGLFYWSQELDRYFQRELQLCAVPGFDPGLPPDTPCAFGVPQFGFFDTSVDTENAAAFGQVDWRFSDDWTVTLGLRYTYDDLDFEFDRPTDPILFPAVPPASFKGGDDDTDLSGKFALQWDVNDNLMTYASYTRGYKSQGFDIIFGMTPDRAEPVDPETSDAFEVGLKGELFDRRLRLGVSAFHTKFDDFQGQAFDADQGAFVLTSAGSVITRGVEFDTTAKPTANLLLNAALAYTDAYYDDFETGPCWTGQTAAQGCIGGIQNLTDEDVPNSPDWKLTVQGRYDVLLNGPVNLFVSGAFRWQDDATSAVSQRPSLEIDSYAVFDLTVGVDSDDGKWSAAVFAKNLFDENYTNVVIETPLDAVDGTSQFLSRDFQRYVGARLEYRFGG
jgi:iron complex outermembrane receptor protein